VRLLTTDPQYQRLALYFRYRTVAPTPNSYLPTTMSEIFQTFCDNCNKSGSYFERKMFSMMLDLIIDSSKDETGVQWIWWDQDGRKDDWYWRLRQPTASEFMHEYNLLMCLLPLWVHCIDLEAGQFVFHQAKLEPLYESWKEWVAPLFNYSIRIPSM